MVNKHTRQARYSDKPRLTALSWLILFTIGCVLLLTWIIIREIQDRVHEESASSLTATANSVANAVSNQVQLYSSTLGSYRGIFVNSPSVPSNSTFSGYYKLLQQNQNTKLPSTVIFAANDSTNSLLKYVPTWASNGQPLDTNLADNLPIRTFLDNIRSSGLQLGTNTFTSLKGISLVQPVYVGASEPKTTSQRQSQLAGFMIARIPYSSLFSSTIGTSASPDVSYQIKDISAGSKNMIYSHSSSQTKKNNQLSAIVPLPVAGQVWQLTASADQNYTMSQTAQELSTTVIVFNAALITMLLIVLYFQVQNRRERLLEQTKDEFVTLSSHQLRAPLTSIKLFVEMLLDDKLSKFTDKQREYLTNIQFSTGRMIELVTDFLNISQLELGQMVIKTQALQLEDIVANSVTQLSPLAHTLNVTIEFEKPKLNSVQVEPNLYGQIVNNLVSNAIYYSHSGGVVKVALSESPKGYQLDVSDNGIGIPESARSNLYKRFYRADNAKHVTSEGSGLGLYLIKKISDMTDGSVWYDSVEGQGTTFHVIIPISGMSTKTKGIRSK